MSDVTPIDAALEGLSDLAACDLRLAKRFAGRIEALPEDEDGKAMDLARSYQRMARSYRQTIVVQARLRRELKAEARADEGDARAERQAAERARVEAVGRHRMRVRRHFERAVWDEYEADDAQEVFNDLDARLFEFADDADFLDTPAEALIARLSEEFDIGAGAREADNDAPDAATRSERDDDPAEAPVAVADEPAAAAAPEPAPTETHSPEAEPPEAATEPEPPPRPPDPPPEPWPEPYIPPWEQLRPGQRWPGSSGW
ncbi:hypothetical protein [uncultured Phenylobacterium sp.]|uniref:hypothetical protein n=1 Tax=uncultured Phenylobacterium sp. TaxID=349273 RepID=UPI0025E3F8F5|nr:hypothetical protein [uncultured Phenylobacterium sp.]